MDNKGSVAESKSNKISEKKCSSLLLGARWLFLAAIVALYFVENSGTVELFVFLETVAVVAVYNFLVFSYLMKGRRDSSKGSRNAYIVIYMDMIALSVFAYQLGGVSSDIYLFYFFLLGYYGMNNSTGNSIKASVFCLLLYSLAVFLYARSSLEEFNLWRLILRDLFIVAASYGISIISHEVKKYDEMHKKEFRLARTDRLTGLANRHYFDQKLKEEADYADSTGNPLNILIFDLDNFKRFNDTYGHIWGDKLLTLFSDIIKQNIRKSDIPVRYGGEEFLILIRDLDIEIAKSVGERIRKQLERQKIYVGNELEKKKVTVSCGLAQYPKHSNNIKEAIDYADKALYHAKETGKNMVVGFDEMIKGA